jgi:hypothetical protein
MKKTNSYITLLTVSLVLLMFPVLPKNIITSWAATNYLAETNCLVAYQFEESSGTALDKCVNGTYNGTLGSGVTQASTGKYNYGYQFNNTTNGYVTVADHDEIDSATDLTFAAWVYHASTSGDDGVLYKNEQTTDGILLYRDDVGSVSGRTDTYGAYIAEYGTTDSARIEGATNASPLNTWTHVCWTLDLASSTGLRLYVNGTEDANSPVSLSSIATVDSRDYNFTVGLNSDFTGSPFDGYIDEVIVINGIATPTQIAEIMNYGLDGAYTAPAAGSRIMLLSKLNKRWRIEKNYGYLFVADSAMRRN